jgi:hypothetical protein
MLTEIQYQEYCRKSREDNYFLKEDEKEKIEEYLNFISSKIKKTNKGGILDIIAYGPRCWNGGNFRKSKEEGGKKCWSCNYYHD